MKNVGLEDREILSIPVIVFWTDAPVAPLLRTKSYFKTNMPVTYPKFEKLWSNSKKISQEQKLLILFGPENTSGWNTIRNWERYSYGGTLLTGNEKSIKVIAKEILRGIPEGVLLNS